MTMFPALSPNFLSELETPDFGVVVYTMDDGTEVRRFVHSNGYKTGLSLKYEGKTADEVKTFVDFWKLCKGTFATFNLPDSIIQHPDAYRAGLIDLAGSTDGTLQGIQWRFEGKPTINTVVVDIYNFEVRLLSMTKV